MVGIRDSQLSENLQMDPTLTLEIAVAQSRQVESVRKQQAIIPNLDAVSLNPSLPTLMQSLLVDSSSSPYIQKDHNQQYGSQLS